MKIYDLLREKAAEYVRREANSPDCLWVNEVSEFRCSGPCDCCGEEDVVTEIDFEIPKFPDQTFYGHLRVARFKGNLNQFISHLDRNYE